ncbi:hypothetical protein BSL78_07591 [Apostichopus japonicus]|uniref:Uncharacterized protein n=1 Tax=Stichopus japonicus TaxID=307972 RepID=A0A2G8L5V3_STIJA|nr:hypothetical protein BSL78_07591 [Apostichopus japonicus]
MVKSITEKSRESQSPHQPSNLGQFRRLGETRTSYMTAVRRGYTLGTLSYTSSDRDSTVCEETDQGSSNDVLSVTSISNEAQSCTDSAWKSSFGDVKETTIKITENLNFINMTWIDRQVTLEWNQKMKSFQIQEDALLYQPINAERGPNGSSFLVRTRN